jgi:hypothetical protein
MNSTLVISAWDNEKCGVTSLVHLFYCDNADKKGEHILDKIISGEKQW